MRYIYGGGRFGMAVATVCKEQGQTFEFLDRYLEAAEIDGVPVHHPDDVEPAEGDTVLVTAVVAPKTDGHENVIPDNVRKMGFKDVRDLFDVFEAYPRALELFCHDGSLWRKGRKDDLVNTASCDAVLQLLSDERSRELFANIIDFRSDPRPDNYIRPDIGFEYFPEDLLLYELEKITYLDIGAFGGDTLTDTMKRIPAKISAYFAFEPDATNFARLSERARSLSAAYPGSQIACFPMAATTGIDLLPFEHGQGSVSRVSREGSGFVQGVDIDSIFAGTRINFFKVDIEGHEISALNGARKAIQRFRPVMAVACYHEPQDIWEIPLLLSELLPDSDFAYRQHGHWGEELTLYVIPR